MMFKKLSPVLVGLLISVALNGVLLGALLSTGKDSPQGEKSRRSTTTDFDIGNISRSLPQEQRETFAALFTAQDRQNMGIAFRDHSRRQRELAELVAASPLDSNAVTLKLAEIREARELISILGDKTMGAFLEKLSAKERIAIVKIISERRRSNNVNNNQARGNRSNANNNGMDGMDGTRGGNGAMAQE